MRGTKFVLPAIPDSTNKTIRFPDNLIEEIEGAIRGTGNTFSSFVVAATRFALDHMNDLPKDDKQKEDALSHG